MSPASAASTALRVNRSASPSNKVAAANVAVFLEPRHRPAGLPDCPDWNSRPRRRPRHNSVAQRVDFAALLMLLLYTQYGIASMAISRLGRSSPEPDPPHTPGQSTLFTDR